MFINPVLFAAILCASVFLGFFCAGLCAAAKRGDLMYQNLVYRQKLSDLGVDPDENLS
jgi:hypothetical protein